MRVFSQQISDGARRCATAVRRSFGSEWTERRNNRAPFRAARSAWMTMTAKPMTEDARGVHDDQHHILGHLTTGFVPGVIDNITLSIPDTSSRTVVGRSSSSFFRGIFFSRRRDARRRMFKPLLASSARDAASQITSADRSLGTAESSEPINLYRSLEPSRHVSFSRRPTARRA